MEYIHTNCCIVGGGPAGIILAYLLAKAGVEVVVIEKHSDFFRDFRGDTVHPSTLELINQMGLLYEFLQLPHQKVSKFKSIIGDKTITFADFSKLNVIAPYIAIMPQWDFLNFFVSQAKNFSNFTLMLDTEACDIDLNNKSITAINNTKSNKNITISSNLIIAADGRNSTIRNIIELKTNEFGAPMDVLWFRLSKKYLDPDETGARFTAGNIMVMINRGDYWQCAYIIAKGSLDNLKENGLNFFKKCLLNNVEFIADRLDEIKSWNDIKLLTVKVDRLQNWHVDNKLLFIGDAAHAMSPVGGVGINLAIQDAVATYNYLKQPLLDYNILDSDLKKIQARRELPVKIIQKIQVMIHERLISKVITFDNKEDVKKLEIPFVLKILTKFKFFNKITAYIIGIGIRSEKIV